MGRIRMVGAALVAAFALGAVASTSAMAVGPIWKVAGAKLEAAKSEALTGKQTANFVLKGKAFGFIEVAVTCKKESATGKIIGGEPGTGEATIKFTECSSSSCTPTEPIEAKTKSELVYYTKAEKKLIGEVFFAKEASGIIATIECTGLKAELTGNVGAELLTTVGTNDKDEPNNPEHASGYAMFDGTNAQTYENAKGEGKTAELKWEGKAASLEGTAEVTLNSEKTFVADE